MLNLQNIRFRATLAPYLLLLALPFIAHAQCPPPTPSNTGSQIVGAGFGSPPSPICPAPVSVQAGRKFVMFQVVEQYTYWQSQDIASKCVSANDCADFQATLAIKGPKGQDLVPPFTLKGSAKAAPQGSNWLPELPVPPSGQPLVAVRFIPGVIDVSDLTKGPITITLTGSNVGNPTYVPFFIDITFYGNSRFTLTQTSYLFRPNDLRDPANTCQFNAFNCFVVPTGTLAEGPAVLLAPDGSLVPVHFEYSLETPRFMHGNWLRGISTNYGKDTEGDPDYLFEAAPNAGTMGAISSDHLSIKSLPNSWQSVTSAWITSHDYGGSANVRLKGTILGNTFDAEELSDPVFGMTTSPPCAGSGIFASIPIDQDCNGIADFWEDQYLGQGVRFTNPNRDTEAAPGGSDRPGDGFTPREEYRGFHYVTDDWSESDTQAVKNTKLRWTSTDPVAVRDVFFWDSSPDGRFTKAIQANLSTASGNVSNGAPNILASQTPGIQYRRVSAALAHAADPADPREGVTRFNVNGFSDREVYAVDYAYVVRPSGAQPPPPAAQCTGANAVMGDPGANMMSWRPALIFEDRITDCSNKYMNVIPVDVLRAWVIAHTTGHRYTLSHYYRDATMHALPDLTRTQYGLGTPATQLYNRLQVYQLPSGAWTLGDMLDLNDLGLEDNQLDGPQQTVPANSVPPAGSTDYMFLSPMDHKVPANSTIRIFEQRLEIMDYEPRWTGAMGTAGAWHFSPSAPNDARTMCVSCIDARN